jgi:hypothetical protein
VEPGYKAFIASLIKSIELEEDRFGVEPEFIAKLAQRGCRVYDVGIHIADGLTRKARRVIGKTE